MEKLEKLRQEYSLKDFYTIVCKRAEEGICRETEDLLIGLAPFIRLFHSKFVNYYKLTAAPPVHSPQFTNRLVELYSDLCNQLIANGTNGLAKWLLQQKISAARYLFPFKPVPSAYQDIMRGLNTLTELFKSIPILNDKDYDAIFNHVKGILSPQLDEEFESEGRELLNHLNNFNARKEGSESRQFGLLDEKIQRINKQIQGQLMSNNTYVSIIQQINNINKALKNLRKSDFEEILKPQELGDFWEGLKDRGYAGGDNYLYGDFEKQRDEITNWLSATNDEKKDVILNLLKRVFHGKELSSLEKINIPEAVHLYAINVLGVTGLRTDEAIRLVLGFQSRFVEKMVRDGAHSALIKNSMQVREFFYRLLGETEEYDQQVTIADTHDSIFGHIKAASLVTSFGDEFRESLEELDRLTSPDGILLSNFIRSAYLKTTESSGKKNQSDHPRALESHFREINSQLHLFKNFVDDQSKDSFIQLIRMWGLNYIVSWSLTDFANEKRLFSFIVKAAETFPATKVTTIDKTIPLQGVITLLSKESDAKKLIQKLMTYLLNSKISFDYRLFSSLFQVIAQRHQQLHGGINIRDGFSEQRGYGQAATNGKRLGDEIPFQDPHIFHPIVIFLITVLHMKFINIPKDAFVETDISLYLNSLAERQVNPQLGYQNYLAHQLIASIPYIKDFSSHHETVIRKTIADLDESYRRENTLIHYLRIKIHRAPSRLDLDFCLEILQGLSEKNLDVVLNNLIRLMKGIGDEAIPDLETFFGHNKEKLEKLGKLLRLFKAGFPDTDWQDIAENQGFTGIVRDLPEIDPDSTKDIIALVKLANLLSNYWTQRINLGFFETLFIEKERREYEERTLEERMDQVREKRKSYQDIVNKFDPFLEPYQHIFLKRHVIQGDWNFDFFGFWPYYKETKFEAYNAERRLANLERNLIEQLIDTQMADTPAVDSISMDIIHLLRHQIACLTKVMNHLVDEGLAPSRYFLDTIEIFEKDQLTISQLHDILGILSYRELSHIDAFFANTFEHFPARITRALGRENLDFDLDKLSIEDEELLYPLVQETVLGNIIASAYPIHLLENVLNKMMPFVSNLREIGPSLKIFEDEGRPKNRLSPVYFGYKSYALQTLARDGFNVPSLETLPVYYFEEHPEYLNFDIHPEFKNKLIESLLKLEKKTEKRFSFNTDKLTPEQASFIEQTRAKFKFNSKTAPQLFISARSGSYRSMPGILGTVLNIGFKDIVKSPNLNQILRFQLNTYRMFLSTFGNVVLGINEVHFSRVVEESKKMLKNPSDKKIKWEDLRDDQIIQIIADFKELIESRSRQLDPRLQINPDWDDPLELLAISVIGVWNSWLSPASKNLRSFLNISPDWKTPVSLMEMKQADLNDRSFSAILFSGDPQGKTNKPHGDLLFGRPGEDIAAGLASEGKQLEEVEFENPELYHEISDLLEKIKINKGYINVDVEMVGEFDPDTNNMELFVVQERQMPLGVRGESEDYRLTPTQTKPVTSGRGVNGGVQYGVFLDGVNRDYYQLRDVVRTVRESLGVKDHYHGPGIFLLMKYVTPEEALKMNIEGVDGIITTKIGKSSHASIAAKRDGKLFVCETRVTEMDGQWSIGKQTINMGDSPSPDIFTVVGNPKSVSPYSGNIYEGKMPLTRVMQKR